MENQAAYRDACNEFRRVRDAIVGLASELRDAVGQHDRELGEALLRPPHRVSFDNLPTDKGIGVAIEALAATTRFNARYHDQAVKVAQLQLKLVEADHRVWRAYERLSPSERVGISRPSEIIDRVD